MSRAFALLFGCTVLAVAQEEAPLRALRSPDPEARRQAIAALGRAGRDVVLPDLLALLEEPLDGRTQVVLGRALCRLGATAGVDLLFAVAFQPDGDTVAAAYAGLKEALDPALPLAEARGRNRSALYALKRRWDREGDRWRLRGAPPRPSAALGRRIEELLEGLARARGPEVRRRQERLAFLRGLAAPRVLARQAAAAGAERRRFAKVLLLMGIHALPALEAALAEGPWPRRRAALEVVAELPAQVRTFAALGARLARLGPTVGLCLAEAGPEHLGAVLRALAWTGGPEQAPKVAALLDRDDVGEDVRLEAVRTLGRLGAPDQAPRLLALSRAAGASLALRTEAALGAVLLGRRAGVGRLVALLDEGPDPLEWLRRVSGGAYFGYELDPKRARARWRTWWERYGPVVPLRLAELRESLRIDLENRVFAREIREGWLAGLRREHSWLDRVDAEARVLAVGPWLVPTLRAVLAGDPDPWLRFHAAQVLAILELRAGVPALVSAATDPFPLVRGTAAEGLGRIGQEFGYLPMSEALRPALLPLLRDVDGFVRNQAALALARLGFADGVPVLLRNLMDPRPGVADHAWITLRRVTGGRDEGFDPRAPLARRRRALAALWDWWEREGPRFHPRPPR